MWQRTGRGLWNEGNVIRCYGGWMSQASASPYSHLFSNMLYVPHRWTAEELNTDFIYYYHMPWHMYSRKHTLYNHTNAWLISFLGNFLILLLHYIYGVFHFGSILLSYYNPLKPDLYLGWCCLTYQSMLIKASIHFKCSPDPASMNCSIFSLLSKATHEADECLCRVQMLWLTLQCYFFIPEEWMFVVSSVQSAWIYVI